MRPSRASAPSFGTSDQCPPTTRFTSRSSASRLRPRSLPSPGAAANIRVSPAGCCVSSKRSRSAISSSSGVPMPTKPETATVSPSRTSATASAADTILFLSMAGAALGPLRQPLRDARAEQPLRLAADEDADMPARQRKLGVVVGAELAAERLRGRGRDDVVVLGEDVQHRRGDVPELDLAAAEHELALHELVVLVEVLEPLLRGLARVVRPVGDPLLHAQEV